MPAQARAEPPAACRRTAMSDGLLSARLAGALNGPVNGAAHDDDLTDLLAPDSKQAGRAGAHRRGQTRRCPQRRQGPAVVPAAPVRGAAQEQRRAAAGGPRAAADDAGAWLRRPPRRRRSSCRGPRCCARRCRRCSAPRPIIPGPAGAAGGCARAPRPAPAAGSDDAATACGANREARRSRRQAACSRPRTQPSCRSGRSRS